MEYRDFDVELEYINRILGVKIDAAKATDCATKMGLVLKGSDATKLTFEVPPTRADILHPCDLIEDVGIGYGFNNIPKVFPANNTVGSFQPNNKMTDHLRHELAQAGYIESLNFALLSFKDNYLNMRQEVDLAECVQLSNPKTIEFEIVRTTLMPGLLKCLQFNKKNSIPQKVFEISDCVVLDVNSETGARNVRRICALYLDQSSSFEVIHGLLDMVMTKVGADFSKNYKLVQDDNDPRYLPTRGVAIQLNGSKIGSMGVLHPEVLNNFELKYPVSAIEIEFDPLFEHFKTLH
jgi:phenylalanyl-tRNA synthetase beta chain